LSAGAGSAEPLVAMPMARRDPDGESEREGREWRSCGELSRGGSEPGRAHGYLNTEVS
jgi:hypothetical protein